MDKDLIIFDKETREVIAIIPSCNNETVVCKKEFDSKIVDSNSKHLEGDMETGKIYLIQRLDNIAYIEDYL